MKRYLLNNIGWKLFSLLLSVALWLALVGESEVSTFVNAPVKFENLPADLEISSDIVERLYIKASGPVSRVNMDNLRDAAVVLDLATVQSPGERTFNLDRSNVQLPAGLKLERVVPSQLRVRLERRGSKEVLVEVRFAGPPPQGYRVVGTQVMPPRLRLAGPQSRLDQITSVQTDAIDLKSSVSETGFTVPVYVEDPHLRFEGPAAVQVRVLLEKIPASGD